MTDKPTAARAPFADIAPALVDYTDRVLFGDVWERPGLSPRDRSLITVATLVALYRTNELPVHLKKALDNGVSRIVESAPAAEMFARPQHAYTKALFAATPRYDRPADALKPVSDALVEQLLGEAAAYDHARQAEIDHA